MQGSDGVCAFGCPVSVCICWCCCAMYYLTQRYSSRTCRIEYNYRRASANVTLLREGRHDAIIDESKFLTQPASNAWSRVQRCSPLSLWCSGKRARAETALGPKQLDRRREHPTPTHALPDALMMMRDDFDVKTIRVNNCVHQ